MYINNEDNLCSLLTWCSYNSWELCIGLDKSKIQRNKELLVIDSINNLSKINTTIGKKSSDVSMQISDKFFNELKEKGLKVT